MTNVLEPVQASQPPRSLLSANIAQQSALLNQLFSLVANPPSSASTSTSSLDHPINQLYAALQGSTVELSRLVKDVWDHQEAWRELQKVKEQVKSLDGEVKGMIRELEKNRSELEGMVEEGRRARETIDRVTNDPLPILPLFAHARALARHSSAPVSSLLAPIDKAQYQPWPTEMTMRSGILFREGGSMTTGGEMGVVGEGPIYAAEDGDVEEDTSHVVPTRPHVAAPAVFNLDLNSDDSDEEL